MECFLVQSGGVNPLNFTVKTYPSETELKAAKPSLNTIGVITTTTMTKWVFSATEPKEPEVGMVWFAVGTSSVAEFNALKKNTLQVYPISAKQYVGGKWESITIYSYQNGEWSDLVVYLYNSGNEFEELTGGFREANFLWTGSGFDYMTGTIQKNANNIYLECPCTNCYESSIMTSKKIDVSEYDYVCVEGSGNDNKTNLRSLTLVSADGQNAPESIARIDIVNGITKLPISDITGSYHIAVKTASSDMVTKTEYTIDSIWLE